MGQQFPLTEKMVYNFTGIQIRVIDFYDSLKITYICLIKYGKSEFYSEVLNWQTR